MQTSAPSCHPPPPAASAVYSWALTIGILTWRSRRPALPSDPPSPWQLEPGRPGLCVRITDPEFTILLLPCKQKQQLQQQHAGSSAGLEGTEKQDPQGPASLRHGWESGMPTGDLESSALLATSMELSRARSPLQLPTSLIHSL